MLVAATRRFISPGIPFQKKTNSRSSGVWVFPPKTHSSVQARSFLGSLFCRPRKNTVVCECRKDRNPPPKSACQVDMAVGQNPTRTPSEHPNPTTKIGPKMGGEFTYQPKWAPKTVLTTAAIFCRDPYIIHLNIATCKWWCFQLYFGVEKATCFKWWQHVSFKEPCLICRVYCPQLPYTY